MIIDEQQITNQRNDYLFVFNSGDSLIKLPCKPTHPNVTISLTHVNAFNGNGYLGSNHRIFLVVFKKKIKTIKIFIRKNYKINIRYI